MSLSTTEFRAIGAAMFGEGWQTRIAARLDVDARTVRRWASGDTPIPDWVPLELGLPSQPWPLDRWIVGDGDDSGQVYVVHTHSPQFIARLVRVDDDGRALPSEGEADLISGVTIAVSDRATLCEVHWIGPIPLERDIDALMLAAADVAAGYLDDVADLDDDD